LCNQFVTSSIIGAVPYWLDEARLKDPLAMFRVDFDFVFRIFIGINDTVIGFNKP
jgi:hypothetical protein